MSAKDHGLPYLRAWRLYRGMKQRELGPPGWISDLERGIHGATYVSVCKLAEKLRIRPIDLLRSSPPGRQRKVS